MEAHVTTLIEASAAAHRLQLVAYAVMPNHLHLLVVQGRQPFGRFMHALLRRIALRVQRRHQRIGHVFERRYFAAQCTDPDYFRNAVAYIHLNPVRAGLCRDVGSYGWTSHALYIGRRAAPGTLLEIAALNALRIFSAVDGCSVEQSRVDYERFLAWRLSEDGDVSPDERPAGYDPPPPPFAFGGDASWFAQYRTATANLPAADARKPDLRDVAVSALAQLEPGMSLDLLCSGSRSRRLVSVRRQVIARCHAAGHPTSRIARFLNVSTTTISRSTPA